MIALVDADGPVFRACSAASTDIQWHDDLITSFVHPSAILAALRPVFRDIVDYGEADEMILYFSGPSRSNWRRTIDDGYKSHRVGGRPLGWDATLEWLEREGYTMHMEEHLEADDLVGAAWKCDAPEDEIIRVSEDKDLLTIPGRHLNPRTGDVVEVDEETADFNWLCQAMTGDRADGYPGCPKVGPKTAPPIVRAGWPAIVAAFEKQGLTEADAIRNARVARILRRGEIAEDGTVTLWSPDESGNV